MDRAESPRAIVPHDTELPPPRPGVRYVRVRVLGIVVADDNLRGHIDRRFHWPMIVLALLTLPLLVIDVLQHKNPNFGNNALQWFVWVGFGIIWLAFLIEFVVKITIAECRIEYLKRNWLDVIIIVAPVLRPLRAMSIAKTSKVFTLRGVGMKFARYVITLLVGLEATDRLLQRLGLKPRVERPDPNTMTRLQLQAEVKRLRRLADDWEEWYDAHESGQFAGYPERPAPTDGADECPGPPANE